jgi:hypothetical protein
VRVPVKSETDAFRIAYGTAALIGGSIALGAASRPLVGVALFGGGVLGALGWDLATKDPDRATLGDAARTTRPRERGDTSGRRILVIANETLGGRELRDELLRHAEEKPELRVVAPVLPSRAHYIASDIDRELAEARKRLNATLAWAAEHGLRASGRVHDIGPVAAIEDELRTFRADELIISTHPPERSHWLESGVVERAREELDMPVTHVVVDLARDRVEIAG